MAGERTVLRVAAALAVLGVAALIAQPGDTGSAGAAVPGGAATATTLAPVPAIAGDQPQPAPERPHAKPPVKGESATRAACPSVVKHAPIGQLAAHEERTISDFAPDDARVLGSGRHHDHPWRLYLGTNERYGGPSLALNSDTGGFASVPDEPLVTSAGTFGDDDWAFMGTASAASTCVVVRAADGSAVATDELFSDGEFPRWRFFLIFVPCALETTTLESYDADGQQTGSIRATSCNEVRGMLPD